MNSTFGESKRPQALVAGVRPVLESRQHATSTVSSFAPLDRPFRSEHHPLPSLRRKEVGDVRPEPIRLPPIWCPLPLRARSGDRAVQQQSEKFFAAHGFGDRAMSSAKAMGTGRLACMWAPEGTAEGVQLLSDWLMWALLFDDRYCDAGEVSRDPTAFGHVASRMFEAALAVEREGIGDGEFDGFAAALGDIFARIARIGGAEQALLCSRSQFQWALGAACGVGDRNGNYLRGLEEHLIARPMDGADSVSIHLIEIAEGTWLDSATRLSGPVRAITAAAGLLLTVPTDLASYGHESRQAALESNVVAILAADNDCSVQTAVEMAGALLEEVMQLFVDLRERLAADAGPALRHYLSNLSNMVRGTLEWQRVLPRYACAPEQYADLASGDVAAEPLHEIAAERHFTRVEPPAAIRWWWGYV